MTAEVLAGPIGEAALKNCPKRYLWYRFYAFNTVFTQILWKYEFIQQDSWIIDSYVKSF